MRVRLTRYGAALGAMLAIHGPGAYACTACFGDPESSQTQGMNAAIFTMLGVTGGVLLIAAGVVLHVVWNNRGRADDGIAPAEIAEGGASSW